MRITVAYLLKFGYYYCVVLIGYMTTGGNCKSAISAQRFESVLCHSVNIVVPLILNVLVKVAV